MADTLTVEVRQMRPADTSAVAALTTQLGYPSTEDEIRRRYDLIKDRWDARVFVAQHAGNVIIGWIHVQATYMLASDARAEIWGLVVADKARGIGVGRRLVEAAEEWALMRGLERDRRELELPPHRSAGLLRASWIYGDENTERLPEEPDLARPCHPSSQPSSCSCSRTSS